ncbi:type I-E CRISPR-associated protein Cse2/CasB [Corynebacterium sp. sy017]|uniref:type I-E CRISPR-associated protein Cse2/CasB n=1 Tax=unclassified Corynebacterium TaxID=2624378 RepID=UPI001185DE25|nr:MULTISPECIES: type I-E CRISPR-associated protein Cse2/CasB [unclassified Corynebacterium]MBP3088479.1 type I-E CRISPR-associated protein Cse2/CasB [Corynebacterium sp. sy017]TSD91787.1 type I-E CRISPR-associated protein Cse2/CasB [Corynebacterium sp. SY003]
MTDTKLPWEPLIGEIVPVFHDRSNPRMRSALRAGGVEHTETRAYPYVLPCLGAHPSAQQRTALLRTTAIIAHYPDLFSVDSKKERSSVGSFLATAARSMGNDRDNAERFIGIRISQLHTQDIEEATATFRRLFAFLDSERSKVQLNAWSFVELFWYWGNGYSEPSVNHRLKVLRDFYMSENFTPVDQSSSNEPSIN